MLNGCFSKLFSLFAFLHEIGDYHKTLKKENKINLFICIMVCLVWILKSLLYPKSLCRLIKPIEHNDPTPSPNSEFPVFEAEEDDVEEIPNEITRLLEHEEKIIQPHLEDLETVNLGSEDCVRE